MAASVTTTDLYESSYYLLAYRYLVGATGDSPEPATIDRIVRVLSLDRSLADSEETRTRLFRSLVCYLSVLRSGFPDMGVMVVNEIDDIPGLTAEQKRRLLELRSTYRYRETASEGATVAEGCYWSPLGGQLDVVTITFRDGAVVALESHALTEGIGRTGGQQ